MPVLWRVIKRIGMYVKYALSAQYRADCEVAEYEYKQSHSN